MITLNSREWDGEKQKMVEKFSLDGSSKLADKLILGSRCKTFVALQIPKRKPIILVLLFDV